MDADRERASVPEDWYGHERAASKYLETAEAALIHAQFLANNRLTTVTHPEFYENCGLTHDQLGNVLRLGFQTMENVSTAIQNPYDTVPHRIRANGHLRAAVKAYQGLSASDEAKILSTEHRQALTELLEESKEFPDTDSGLALAIEQGGKIIDSGPYFGDFTEIVGLSIIKLARFLGQDKVQTGIAVNTKVGRYGPNFRRYEPIEQAALMVASHFVGEGSFSQRATLVELIGGNQTPDAALSNEINDALSELLFADRIRRYGTRIGVKPYRFFANAIGIALTRTAAGVEKIIDCQPVIEDVSGDNETAAELAAQESEIRDAVMSITRRARHIIGEANKLDDIVRETIAEHFDIEDIPDPETPISDWLQEQAAARRAGEIAARTALQAESREQAAAELAGFRNRFLVSPSQVRKHERGKQIATLVARGEAGGIVWDAPALGTREAFEAAGMILRLNNLLDNQQNVEVFGSLYDAMRREDILRNQYGMNLPQGIAAPAAWVSANKIHLRHSTIPELRRIGDGLAAYELAQQSTRDPQARPRTNVTIETLMAVERIRDDARKLDVRAFPPDKTGRKPRVDVGELIDDARAKIAERRRGRRNPGPILNELRFLVLDGVANHLIDDLGFQPEHVDVVRMLPGSWRQTVPYYAVILNRVDRKLIVAENPKEPNSTIVFEELNAKLAPWTAIVQLGKSAIKQVGGRKMRHSRDPSLDVQADVDYHTRRVNKEVDERIEY